QRRLHGVEQEDHAEQARHHIHLVEHVRLVGRDDRHAERLAEAGGKNEEPDERTHQRRYEALALMQIAQHLTPDDALEAGDVSAQAKARRLAAPGAIADACRYAHLARRSGRDGGHAARSVVSVLVNLRNASLTDCVAVLASRSGTDPLNSTRPLCSSTTRSVGRTSSNKCVAHSTPRPSFSTSERTMLMTLSRE